MHTKIFESDCDDIITGLDTEEMVSANAFMGMAVRSAKKYPLLFIPTFIEDFMQGMYARKMIQKYGMLNFNNFNMLLYSFKMKSKRYRDSDLGVKHKNLQDPVHSERYRFFCKYAKLLHSPLENLLNHNILQALVSYSVLQHTYLTSEDLHDSVMDAYSATKNGIAILHDKERVASFEEYMKYDASMKIHDIVSSLYEQGHVVVREGDVSVTSEYPKFAEHVYDLLRREKDGISYAALQRKIFNKFPLFWLAVSNVQIFENILDGLESRNLLARKKSFWKYSPSNDQLFTPENYDAVMAKMSAQAVKSGRTKFFGREIGAALFLDELKSLEYGDLDDEDDQVTRIAGLVLSDAALLQSPHESMREFDFVVDLKNYNFRPEQEEIMQKIDFQVNSTMFHCKVMINKVVRPSTLSKLASVVPAGEQAVIFTCMPTSSTVSDIVANNKTIQIINEESIRDWCTVTPVSPCRKGSVARVRYGDNVGKITLVKSLNYESGLAAVETIPDRQETLVPIGSIEEMLPNVSSLDDFEAVSESYVEFLHMLSDAAQDSFERGMNARIVAVYDKLLDLKKDTNPEMFDDRGRYLGYDDLSDRRHSSSYGTKYVRFENVHVAVDMSYSLDRFKCTCGHLLNYGSYKTLCPHLVAGLDHLCREYGDAKTISANIDKIKTALSYFRFANMKSSVDALSFALGSEGQLLKSYLQECSKSEPAEILDSTRKAITDRLKGETDLLKTLSTVEQNISRLSASEITTLISYIG